MKREPTIAVWGHYHGGNLGDELVVATIVDAIRSRLPGARIIGISMAPDDTRARHGIAAYPINPAMPSEASRRSIARDATERRPALRRLRAAARRLPFLLWFRGVPHQIAKIASEAPFSVRSYRLLRGIDLVVVAGSGQLLDAWRGPWQHPYTTFRWALLARLARVPMLYLSVGAGPIRGRLSAFFIRTAVASSAKISVRDRHSEQVLSAIGLPGPLPFCPDIGYALPDPWLEQGRAASRARGGGPVVGLNVMAHEDPRYWPRGDRRRYESYLRKMVAFARWLLDRGYIVRLFSSQVRSDSLVTEDVRRLLAEDGSMDASRLESAVESIEEVDDLVRVIGGCHVVVASRYHSILLSLLLDVPVIALAYHPKTAELLNDVAQRWRCLDIDAFEVSSLVGVFERLLAHEEPATGEPATGAARRARVDERRVAVAHQFDAVFGPGLTERSGRRAGAGGATGGKGVEGRSKHRTATVCRCHDHSRAS